MNFGQLIYWHSFVFGQIYFDTVLFSDNFVFAVCRSVIGISEITFI